MRFSADKSPYKLQIGMVSVAPIAHYLQLSEDGLLIGGGIYDVPGAVLARFREIVTDPRLVGDLEVTLDELRADGFDVMREDGLKTAPRGYPGDHPHVDLLRLEASRGRPARADRRLDVADGRLRCHRRPMAKVSTWCAWLHENIGAELAEALAGGPGAEAPRAPDDTSLRVINTRRRGTPGRRA